MPHYIYEIPILELNEVYTVIILNAPNREEAKKLAEERAKEDGFSPELLFLSHVFNNKIPHVISFIYED